MNNKNKISDNIKESLQEYFKKYPKEANESTELIKYIIKTYHKEIEIQTILILNEMSKNDDPENFIKIIRASVGFSFTEGYLAKEKEIKSLKK